MGREGIPHLKGEIGKPLGEQRIKRECSQVSPAHLYPEEPVEIPGLILCPPRPPPAMQVLSEWEEEKGSKSKGWTSGMAPLVGGWGRGGVPTPSGTHPRLGGPVTMGETLGETVG